MTNRSGLAVVPILLLILVIVIPAFVYFFFEWEKPGVSLDTDLKAIGRKKTITLTVSDNRSGVRDMTVAVVQGQAEHEVTSLSLPMKGTFEKTVEIEIEPRKLGIKDGPATIRVWVRDFSPLKNVATLEVPVTIDTILPRISLLTTAHNVNPGGSCLAVYSLDKKVETSGVMCGESFFRGYPVQEGATTLCVCYFAVPRDVTKATAMTVIAEDEAGNRAGASIPFFVRTAHTFRDDTVRVGPEFINGVAARFRQADPELEALGPVEVFRHINETLREENSRKIVSICERSDGNKLWDGAFLRMPNTAPMALFGDKRAYRYQGTVIGSSVHLGVDLASVMRDLVPAANSGTVVFAEDLGIYGNTIVIDHGQGIFSLYAHLSSMSVSVGQSVKRGDIIGNTGSTGFAGGDHLHFSVIVGGVFVNPIEWWDPHWIRDNITIKLESIPGYAGGKLAMAACNQG